LIVVLLIVLANQLSSALREQVLLDTARQWVWLAYSDARAPVVRFSQPMSPSEVPKWLDDYLIDHYDSPGQHVAEVDDIKTGRSVRWLDPWGRQIAVLEQSVPGMGIAPDGGRFAVSAGPDRSFATFSDNIYSYDQVAGSDLSAQTRPTTGPSTGQVEP
jgi:hypothetical protein